MFIIGIPSRIDPICLDYRQNFLPYRYSQSWFWQSWGNQCWTGFRKKSGDRRDRMRCFKSRARCWYCELYFASCRDMDRIHVLYWPLLSDLCTLPWRKSGQHRFWFLVGNKYFCLQRRILFFSSIFDVFYRSLFIQIRFARQYLRYSLWYPFYYRHIVVNECSEHFSHYRLLAHGDLSDLSAFKKYPSDPKWRRKKDHLDVNKLRLVFIFLT